MTSTDPDSDDRLDGHLRRTLRAVAATVTDDGDPGAVIALTPRRHPARRRLLLAAAAVAVVAAAVTVVRPFDGPDVATDVTTDVGEPDDGPPHLLVTAPGWQVTRADEPRSGEGEMTFTGPTGEVELSWGAAGYYERRLEEWTKDGEPLDGRTIAGHEALVFQSGGEFVALWRDRSYGVELRARWPDVDAFLALSASVEPVGAQEWLAALPAGVVRPADRAAVAEQMLADIPLPAGFDTAPLLRDDGLVSDRYQLVARIIMPVTCAWVGQWVDATAAADAAAAQEAVDAMATSFDWDALREIQDQGGLSGVIWEYATAIATDGTLDGGAPDIPVADVYRMSLGCDAGSVST
jgi:hypothetical protein